MKERWRRVAASSLRRVREQEKERSTCNNQIQLEGWAGLMYKTAWDLTWWTGYGIPVLDRDIRNIKRRAWERATDKERGKSQSFEIESWITSRRLAELHWFDHHCIQRALLRFFWPTLVLELQYFGTDMLLGLLSWELKIREQVRNLSDGSDKFFTV
jgi:hypothetical protein